MTIWQTYNWKQLLLASNQAQEVFDLDGIFVEKRSLWLGQFGLFALWVTQDQNIHFEKLQNLAKEQKCLFVQVETFLLPLNPENMPSPPTLQWEPSPLTPLPKGEGSKTVPLLAREGFEAWYYKKFITPYTALIDLWKTLDEILAEMKPKGRYNIKVAQKKWLVAESVEKTSENIKIFYDLMRETTARDHFSGNSLSYYEKFLEIIPNSELIFVKSENTVVSAGIFVFSQENSIYYYWASTSDKQFRNMMGPYLMQFFAIQKAKDFGSKWYDFLGVATPWEENSPLAWVTDFKSKFTSDFREVSRSYLYVTKPFLYQVFQILRKIKK